MDRQQSTDTRIVVDIWMMLCYYSSVPTGVSVIAVPHFSFGSIFGFWFRGRRSRMKKLLIATKLPDGANVLRSSMEFKIFKGGMIRCC